MHAPFVFYPQKDMHILNIRTVRRAQECFILKDLFLIWIIMKMV